MKKVLFIIVLFLGALNISAQDTGQDIHYLVITHQDGSTQDIDLSSIIRMTFIQNNTKMLITQTDMHSLRLDVNETDRYSFRTEHKDAPTPEVFGTDYCITPAEGEAYGPIAVGSVLAILPTTAAGSTTFAFSELHATTAEELRGSAHYAVKFTVSASKIGGEIDCQENKDAFLLTLYDYTTGTYVDATEGTTGTIVTRKRDNGNYAFRLDLVLQDGTAIKAEYDGSVTPVDDFEPMIPLPVMPNEYIYADPTGTAITQMAIKSMQLRKSNDGSWYFYFMKEGETVPDERNYFTPTIRIAPSFVNQGEVKLTETSIDWAVNYSDIQLSYSNNEWKPAVDNGVMKVNYDDETNTYDIFLSVANHYTTGGYTGGNERTLTISYKGAASPYQGTKK